MVERSHRGKAVLNGMISLPVGRDDAMRESRLSPANRRQTATGVRRGARAGRDRDPGYHPAAADRRPPTAVEPDDNRCRPRWQRVRLQEFAQQPFPSASPYWMSMLALIPFSLR